MFNRLLSLIVKATNITPTYTPAHCLVVTKAVGGCTVCEEVCPHNAITIGRQVQIDEIDCTGCGLCVQACPSQALSSSVSYGRGAPLKCSQVAGDAQSVQCLARLQPSDLLALAGRKDRVTLVRGQCEGCKIGGAEVPERLTALAEDAAALAAVRGRTLETDLLVKDRYDATDNPDTISRRDLLRGGLRGSQRVSADLLAPLEAFGETQAEEKGVPLELEKRFLLLQAARPAEDDPVPWTLPRVHDGCILCPVCTNVCPTDAFHRDLNPVQAGGGGVLKLEPERCNGCNACVTSCPVRVITLEGEVTWGELSGGTQAVYHKTGGGASGAVSRS